MNFLEVIAQAQVLLPRKGRMTYRTLQRHFALDDDGSDTDTAQPKPTCIMGSPHVASNQ